MKNFKLIDYAYNGTRGTVVVAEHLTTEEVKKACILDYVDKENLIDASKIYFCGHMKFGYEKVKEENLYE